MSIEHFLPIIFLSHDFVGPEKRIYDVICQDMSRITVVVFKLMRSHTFDLGGAVATQHQHEHNNNNDR